MLTGPHALGRVVLKFMQEASFQERSRVRFLSRFHKMSTALEDDSSNRTDVSGKYMVHRMHGSWVNFD